MTREPTPKQQQILSFIEKHFLQSRIEPTISEIARHFHMHTNGAAGHLKALEKKGHLERFSTNKGPFKLVQQSEEKKEGVVFPLVSDIAAGYAQESFDYQDQISLSLSYFGTKRTVAVRVRGNSMSGDGIFDGDIVMIDLAKKYATQRDIVAAKVEGEVTLKRLHMVSLKGKSFCDLIPSNPSFSTVRVSATNVEILGRMVGLIRKV